MITNVNTSKRRYKHHVRLGAAHTSWDEGVACIEYADNSPVACTASTLPDGHYPVHHIEDGYGTGGSIVWDDNPAYSGYPIFIQKSGTTVTANVVEAADYREPVAGFNTWSATLYGTRQELSAYWMFLNDSVEEI